MEKTDSNYFQILYAAWRPDLGLNTFQSIWMQYKYFAISRIQNTNTNTFFMNLFEWKYKYFANVFKYFLNMFEYIPIKMEIYIINGGIIQNKTKKKPAIIPVTICYFKLFKL